MEEGQNCADDVEKKGPDFDLLGRKAMASVQSGEEIVISGVSGAFPSSNNIHEFRENLFNKVNMVQSTKRWDLIHPEIPQSLGIIPDIEQYDVGFFGVHERQSQSLDPMLSLIQEKTIEAILDSGLHPGDLENTRTGVYIGACFSENEKMYFFIKLLPNLYTMTGTLRSMLAHRLSYFLKVKGPSLITDTACSSSLYAMEQAYRAIRLGEVDNAIVGGVNLCLHPFITLQFARLGVLSMDSLCKPFDATSNGYIRSEAATVLLLQKAKNAKRIYAEVVHVKTNCDGYKEQSITFPSKDVQTKLLTEFYDECGVDRYGLSFLEAHGTGTAAGDPEECFAVDSVLTREREKPLLIGSVKSSIGHSEPASGMCSIVKCLIAMETGFIPPNIHFDKPRPEITGIVEGRMEVVMEKMPFNDDRGLIGINSFGFGGANCHVLLRRHSKTKASRGVATDDLPRLVCVNGRTEVAVGSLLDSVIHSGFDIEYIKLLHNAFRKNVESHMSRGYSIVSRSGEIMRSIKLLKHFPDSCPPLSLYFGKLNNWRDVGCQLMGLSAFSTCVQKIQKVLGKRINILDVFIKKPPIKDIDSLLGSVVIQMGLIDILNSIEIKLKGVFGYPFAGLLSAYREGSLSLEETIDFAFAINKALSDILETDSISDQFDSSIPNGRISENRMKTLDYLGASLKSKDLSTMKYRVLQGILRELGYSNDSTGCEKVKRFVNNVFNEGSQDVCRLDRNSVVLKVSNSPSNDLEDISTISLFNGKTGGYLVDLVKGLGSLYELGYDLQVSKLYPPVPFPVSRGTEMISPYVKWNHRKPKSIPRYNKEFLKSMAKCGNRTVFLDSAEYQWTFIKGHIIDGRNLFPASGYLFLVWETLSIVSNLDLTMMQVCFENCRFIRATTVPKKGYFNLQINIQSGNGDFEVLEGDSVVVTGRISLLGEKASSEELMLQNSECSRYPAGPVLKAKDVYKELRLRGYSYKGEFRAIEECNVSTSTAYIRWDDNWITFIDNMLQLKILQSDTRLLYVPTFISKLIISAKAHLELLNEETVKERKTLPVFDDPNTGIIRSGGVSISGLMASSIARKKELALPVLESYEFIPNSTELDLHRSVRVNMQIILENALVYKVKAVELVDEFTKENQSLLTPLIKSVLEDQPLIQPVLKILSKSPLEDVDVEIEDKKLESEQECLLVIASNALERRNVLKEALSVLVENGFVITRESRQFDVPEDLDPDFSIFTVHRTSNESLVLLQRQSKTKKSKYVNVDSKDDFHWLPEVQNAIANDKNQDLVLYAEGERKSGVLGLVNCLRREPQSRNVRCAFVMDEREEKFYGDQLRKGMAVNVYKNGQWGTYRHLLLEKENYVESEHCFVNLTARGDLSSLKWIEGPLRDDLEERTEEELIYVYYSALNFRDIMTATGKINVDVITRDRLAQECVQGFEFSGRDRKGRRCMGMVSCGALSTLLLSDIYLKFPIPDDWSMEEAATVPVVYCTVVYALIIRGKMARGESILIHSGTGGIGLAAIKLALHYGCKVFTTVGTTEKREFLRKTFPQLADEDIGNSHDETFKQMILMRTEGRGVDLVLNSLAEEKLVASVRCLARGGRFIEIGKFDLANNHHLNLLAFGKELSFQGVMLDELFNDPPQVKHELLKLMMDLIEHGAIEPLNRTVFAYGEIEQAFRFMATGKHTGKVLVRIREPERELVVSPSSIKFAGIARYFCDPERVYIIAGGLGGFGLELTDWLILRGARKVVLTSRNGVVTGYQHYRLRIWNAYGVMVKISTAPITTRAGCKQLIEESLELGRIDAIFNLAVVLADAVFENQTPEAFVTSFGPKAYATEYLDELTREACPDLSQFVVFSSVSCGRGNAGQTNYGMSNSVMERICEERKQAGLPALAIEWGAIGDVGLVAEMLEDDTEIAIGGTLQQRISNCLRMLDVLLKQKDAAIVSSIVVAEKREMTSADNVIDAVLNILGISDCKSVSFHSTLAELGMDSMTAVEIKQVLERDFEVFLSAKDIRSVTLTKLIHLQGEMSAKDEHENYIEANMLFRLIGDGTYSSAPYLELESRVQRTSEAPTVLLVPGIEGVPSVFRDFAKGLNAHAISLNLNLGGGEKTVVEMAQSLLPTVRRYFPDKTYHLVGYSFGMLVAMELVNILESLGYNGMLICIDSSPLYMKQIFIGVGIGKERDFETAILCHMLSFFISLKEVEKHKESFLKCATWDERLSLAADVVKNLAVQDVDYQKLVANGIYLRSKALMTYAPSCNKLTSDVKLIKPTQSSVTGIEKDYGLSQYFEKPVEIQTFEGNHITILDNPATAEMINSYLLKISGSV